MAATKFSGENYTEKNYLVLSAKMEAVLKAKVLWKYVAGTVNREGPQADFTMQKAIARASIICSLSTKYVAMVVSERDPKKMWEKLKSLVRPEPLLRDIFYAISYLL